MALAAMPLSAVNHGFKPWSIHRHLIETSIVLAEKLLRWRKQQSLTPKGLGERRITPWEIIVSSQNLTKDPMGKYI
jgi:hypothetical protein